jgi:hypothetical protein
MSNSMQRSKRKLRRRSEQYAEINAQRENTVQKQFMIIVDHDRINNVPMIKAQRISEFMIIVDHD